jgi:hypothetical protein
LPFVIGIDRTERHLPGEMSASKTAREELIKQRNEDPAEKERREREKEREREREREGERERPTQTETKKDLTC